MIWTEEQAGYRQLLHEQIMGLIAAGVEANVTDRPGGIFVESTEQNPGRDPHPAPDESLAPSSPIIEAPLRTKVNRRSRLAETVPPFTPIRAHRADQPRSQATPASSRPDLIFFNGLGGSGWAGYVIDRPGQVTPAP